MTAKLSTEEARDNGRKKRRWWALAVPGAGLVFELSILTAAYVRNLPYDGSAHFGALVFVLWFAWPFALAGLLIMVTDTRSRVGWRLSVGLAAALDASAVWGYLDTIRRPDASFIALSGPFVQLIGVLVLGLLIMAMTMVRRRPAKATP